MQNAIIIKALNKEFKSKTAVKSLDLEIREGELFALLGPNGAGKTTTIKMLCCLTAPTSGTAEVMGYDIVKDAIKVKEVIAVSPQETAVAKNLTAIENLEMVAAICGKPKEYAAEIAERFGLTTQPKVIAKKLSGGWQRRLSIAMAIISEPKVLFLDEPTLGLDIEARRDLWDVIREIQKTTTIILTTHYLEEADALSDRIGIIKDGELIELGSGAELKAKYSREGETNPNIDDIYLRIVRGEK
jgi:ABC-type multidrug transport system, ATPase component